VGKGGKASLKNKKEKRKKIETKKLT